MPKKARRKAQLPFALQTLILDRDGWQCMMPACRCPDGRLINPALRSTDDPWAPSIDHVRQLCDGGSNAKGNLRAAHRKCNNDDAHPVPGPPPRPRSQPRPAPLTYRIGDVFLGDQGSAWS